MKTATFFNQRLYKHPGLNSIHLSALQVHFTEAYKIF
jgi:hypothetical protein